MPSRDKYTDPELRDQVKEEIHNSDKGGKPGQWSARKAQMMAAEYKKRGGDYTTDKETGQDESQKNLNQWTEEEWQTKEGSGQAKQDDEEGTRKRYLPKKAWEQMSEKEKKETDEKKVEGSKEGKQFVGNTEEAKGARKAASKGEKEEEKEEEEEEKEEEDDDEKAQTKDQGKGDKKQQQQQQKQKQTDKKDNSKETEAPKTRSASKAEAKVKKDDENNNTNNKTDKNEDEDEDVEEEKAQAGTKRTAKQSNASNKKQKEDDSSAKDDKKDSTNEKQEQAEDANEEEYVPEEDADADEEMDEAEK
ncbi:hypothetical protein PDE_06898 [Penicillium oxalicum 114-2]|uniref:Hypervirulence associated protein TUDOR domain-containing protein n=1 Tax=Penicillium oxalicum (strain 114-2 / CGMCC 5302) TaxID=933388 RepID=S7ZNK8_PENO1|nr:hypothetical protein PDE_06898 [Penicillium oxalicum 114-2]